MPVSANCTSRAPRCQPCSRLRKRRARPGASARAARQDEHELQHASEASRRSSPPSSSPRLRLHEGEDDRDQAGNEGEGAGPVEPRLTVALVAGQRHGRQRQHDQAHRDVDPEDRPPGPPLREQPADQRTEGQEDHRDPGVDPHRAPALLHAEGVDHDRAAGRDHERRADALDRARGDEEGLGLGEAARRRRRQEDDGADLEHAPLAEDLAEPAAHRDERRRARAGRR